MYLAKVWTSNFDCICWALVGCFSFTLQSNSSQTISIELRSDDCGCQVIWCSTPSLSLVKWPLHSLEVLDHCPVEKQKDSPTKCKLNGMVYLCRMLWYQCCLSVPWILNKSQIVPPAKHSHTITPPPCFIVGTTHEEIIRSLTLHLTKTWRLEPKTSILK
jgi:hypothetical protein